MLPLGVAVEGFAIALERADRAALAYHVVLGVDRRLLDPAPAAAPRPGDRRDEPALPHAAGRGAGEWAVFGVAPTATMWLGMAVACIGVAMVTVNAGRFARGTFVEERS